MTVYYCCPDFTPKSAGTRLLYRHVQILNRHGFAAAILHNKPGFRLPDMPDVPVRHLEVSGTLRQGDTAVVTEGSPMVMDLLKGWPVRLYAVVLNWKYVYESLVRFRVEWDWRHCHVRGVLTNSPLIADLIPWAMSLPAHLFTAGINPALYYPAPQEKVAQVSYILRKGPDVEELKAVLRSRDPRLVSAIIWKGLDGLSEEEYAAEIRRSRVFLNLSRAEGLPFSMLEAMRAGCLTAGYHSVGGQRELLGAGPGQNCILAENLDYLTLARRLEPVLQDVLKGDLAGWRAVMDAGAALSRAYSPEEEERTVVDLWRSLIGSSAAVPSP